jgi:hypothetical protein
MRISETRDKVSQGLLDFAWRQRAQIGVSATVEGADRWAVDPEALILFTIGIGRRDPRLFDEMLDWMAFNHDLLSAQRLRNLAGRFPLPSGLVAAVTAWTRQTAPANLLVSDEAGPVQDREPVFSPDILAFVPRPDPTFAQHGFLRPPRQEQASRTSRTRRFPWTCPSGSVTYSGKAAAQRQCGCCSPAQTGHSTQPGSPTKRDSPKGTSATFWHPSRHPGSSRPPGQATNATSPHTGKGGRCSLTSPDPQTRRHSCHGSTCCPQH